MLLKIRYFVYIRTMVVTVAHIMCANNWNHNFKSHFSSLKLWFQVTILVVAHIICTYVLCATRITLWTKDALAFFNYLSLFGKRDYCCWLIISFHFFIFLWESGSMLIGLYSHWKFKQKKKKREEKKKLKLILLSPATIVQCKYPTRY